ncbi:MAG TPA: Ku protein [Candidatus Babeliaceae bacterium]|nr:Ku protein [Candidatus Babeliaceae bacterium]
MRTSWKGSLTFGLVDIAVELYAAIQPHSIGFKLLHAKCHTPITYKRWCSHCNQEVSWDEIEKGIELKDGTYFIITPENLKMLRPKKTDNIAIVEFVNADAIDFVLFDKHYYVGPGKTPYHAFFLFAAALADLGKTAIGQFVMRDKEYVCAIRPYKNILLLTTLNYAYEVKKMDKLADLKAPKLDTAELDLAEQLIGRLMKKSFEIEQFKDTFATELVKRIAEIKKGIEVPEKKRKELEAPKPTSLIKALQASLSKFEEPKKSATKKTTKSKAK